MVNDEFILSEFKKAIIKNKTRPIVDLDDELNKKFNFELLKIEDIVSITGPVIPPNRWSNVRIMLVTRGSLDFVTGMYKFHATKNTLIVFPSRIITSSKNFSADLKGYVVLFNVDFFLQNNFTHKYIEDKKILNSHTQPYIHLSDVQAAEIESIYENILSEKNEEREHNKELIALKIIELLIISQRLFSQQLDVEENVPSTDVVKKFIDLLEKNFLQERSVTFYASKLNMHPNYLNSLIKKYCGITVKESIQNRLLLETKFLLHSTDLSIKEISNMVGFVDPNYFTAFFSRYEKLSPSQYRSSLI